MKDPNNIPRFPADPADYDDEHATYTSDQLIDMLSGVVTTPINN